MIIQKSEPKGSRWYNFYMSALNSRDPIVVEGFYVFVRDYYEDMGMGFFEFEMADHGKTHRRYV